MPIIIQEGRLQIVYKGKTNRIGLSDIECVEADEWMCKIYTSKDEVRCAVRLGVLCEQLSEYRILRCHKGFAVNIQRIKSIDPKMITLVSGRTIPVGRSYKAVVIARIAGRNIR